MMKMVDIKPLALQLARKPCLGNHPLQRPHQPHPNA